jgi:hypothetical protein
MKPADCTIAANAKRARRDLVLISHENDPAVTTAALVLFAVAIGHAVALNHGLYSARAILWVSVGLAVGVIGMIRPTVIAFLENRCLRWVPRIITLCIAIEAAYITQTLRQDPEIALPFIVIACAGLFQFFNLRQLRWPLMVIMVLSVYVAGAIAFKIHPKIVIDVFMFQTRACWALTHGLNPYTFKYPSVYPPGTMFYSPGIVDANGMLTVGFEYPPLSLLMVLPGYLIGGDIRYSQLLAMALSAGLIVAARPGRIPALAATLLLLMPQSIYILDLSWTEPLLVLTFSLFMFCVCRWARAMPYALGLYLSTKQYAVLTLPLLPLLISNPQHLFRVLFKAGLIVALLNMPFFAMSPHAFLRSVVEFQFLQPFRVDSLSYLVLLHRVFPRWIPPMWILLLFLLLLLAVMIPLIHRRVARSPAGFAAAVALVHAVFFALNKQAFGNYYYFVIATACWSVAVSRSQNGEAPYSSEF